MHGGSFRKPMSGAVRQGSSGAAEAVEEALLAADDALDRGRLGRGVPHITLECTAKDDSVGAREHVAGAAGQRVAYLRLRLEDGELAAHWLQFLVAEQIAAAKPRTVEDQRFRKGCEIRRGGEPTHFELAAGDL